MFCGQSWHTQSRASHLLSFLSFQRLVILLLLARVIVVTLMYSSWLSVNSQLKKISDIGLSILPPVMHCIKCQFWAVPSRFLWRGGDMLAWLSYVVLPKGREARQDNILSYTWMPCSVFQKGHGEPFSFQTIQLTFASHLPSSHWFNRNLCHSPSHAMLTCFLNIHLDIRYSDKTVYNIWVDIIKSSIGFYWSKTTMFYSLISNSMWKT